MHLAIAVCGVQLVLGLMFAALFGGIYGARAAAAAISGTVVAVVPGFYMALLILPSSALHDARRQARRLMLGQLGKWILTGGLFIAAFLVFKRDFGPLLITYAACLSSYWLALIVTR